MSSLGQMSSQIKKVQQNTNDEIEKVYLDIDKNLKRVVNNEVNISGIQAQCTQNTAQRRDLVDLVRQHILGSKSVQR
jgi:hypothetical protein